MTNGAPVADLAAALIPRWQAAEAVRRWENWGPAVTVDLATRVRALAAELEVPAAVLSLTAHVAVLHAVSGEMELLVGTDGDVLAVSAADCSWRELVARVHAAVPVPGAKAETVFSHCGHDDLIADEVVLRVRVGEALGLAFDYRADLFAREHVVRLAGYHVAALTALADGPDAAHGDAELLSANESAYQLDDLAGPVRSLPDRRFADLVAEQAGRTPDAVAVVAGDDELTYAELDRRADRIARGLITLGVADEDVVAVASSRTIDWPVAVLGVFRAGGVYLPIDPKYPENRVKTLIERSACRIVVADPDVTGVFTTGGMAVTVTTVPDLLDGDHPDGPVERTVTAGQLAYVYFTSGSTGQPKGALCEHGGMLNHLLAKIEDFTVGPADVVAQNAPLSFDISLWQLIAGWAVGAKTIIVPDAAIRDVTRFLETVRGAGVTVLQVVPSYLDLLLRHLGEDDERLDSLRIVSATGEALPIKLADRWFQRFPGVPLVNAYGATEASDDTTHAVLTKPPEGGVMPLGDPIRNVHVRVVDERLRLRPLGSSGEIVFAGVCVGRGYLNDIERTEAAFVADPVRPGERLYRTGDMGRWGPGGTLEFQGRRDEQVKVRGLRVELGEVESWMLSAPGVRGAAVVVKDGNLAGFYTAETEIDFTTHLATGLPAHMVPRSLRRLDVLPLNANGKVDKKALAAHAAPSTTDRVAPRTVLEERIAAAWSQALKVPIERIGVHDDFYDLGGNSLAAISVVADLDGLITLQALTTTPKLGDLAVHAAGPALPMLVHDLSGGMTDAAAGTVLCLPPAAGNTIHYRPLAHVAAQRGLRVLAAELPGHDLWRSAEPLAALEATADRIVADLQATTDGPLDLWGHSAGAALALACAHRLTAEGREPRRVFLGAPPPATAAALAGYRAEIAATGDEALFQTLVRRHGHRDLVTFSEDKRAALCAMFRHDVDNAARYLAEQHPRLTMPVTLVAAADDDSDTGPAGWSRLATSVTLHELPDGGHLFLRTRSADVVDLLVGGVLR
ncbi:non-ribosomal peptide synthetase [Amycolatopsis keratiniphila]|uniref:Non-ribosomal peptide synthetase n=1 Tax=Amycolatopsis keratiniphila TaxID=129921 RepID=R4TBW4_9PSEU|nr:amino acid adenylation domain-containing protein [Amycolatopsis keratiniphila]AGM07908.1 non-ribosomal peptide synthetase [Amycolatopsis keratiniphila]